MLPKWEFEYAEYLMEEGKFVEGWEQLFYALHRYPELKIDVSSSKMQEWTMEYARNNDVFSFIAMKSCRGEVISVLIFLPEIHLGDWDV